MQTDHDHYNGLASSGASGTFEYEHHADDDYRQAGDLYRLMPPDARERLINNIAGSLAQVTRDDIIERAVANFANADAEYGARVEQAVKDLRNHAPDEEGAEQAPDKTAGF